MPTAFRDRITACLCGFIFYCLLPLETVYLYVACVLRYLEVLSVFMVLKVQYVVIVVLIFVYA